MHASYPEGQLAKTISIIFQRLFHVPYNRYRLSSHCSLLCPLTSSSLLPEPITVSHPWLCWGWTSWTISLASESEHSPGSLGVEMVFKIILKWSLWQRELEGKSYSVDHAGVDEIMEFSVILALSNQFRYFPTAWLVANSWTPLSLSFLICQISILISTVLDKMNKQGKTTVLKDFTGRKHTFKN